MFSTVRRQRASKVQKGGRIFRKSLFVPGFEPETVKWLTKHTTTRRRKKKR